MNNNELESYKKQIEDKLLHLENSAAEIISELRTCSDNNTCAMPDILDWAKGETDLNTQLEIHNHILSRQGQLRRALRRIEMGSFGHCSECDSKIADERLKAHPCAHLCIECQLQREHGTKSAPILKLSNYAVVPKDFAA